MPISINPNLTITAPQGVATDVVLQPGSVIQAKVLALLGNDQVRIAIGGQTLEVGSQIPLQAGQTLQLAVSQAPDGNGIRLAVVNQQSSAAVNPALANAGAALDSVTLGPQAVVITTALAAPSIVPTANQLTPQQAVAVTVAAQTAATQQTSLAPLFANLDVAASLSGLPPKLQQAVAQLLVQRPSLDSNLSGADIKRAFQSSGLFLEASLASGSVPSASIPDLKAALIVLRQVLTTSLNGIAAPSVATPSPTAAALANAITGKAAPSVAAAPAALPGATVVPEVIVAPELPTTASPTLAPLAAATTAASGASIQAVLSALEQIGVSNPASQVMSPAPPPADAAARTAASSAALSQLQEAIQANPQAAGTLSRLVLNNGLMLSLLPGVAGARMAKADDSDVARTNIPPPPIAGALPTAQPVMPATLVAHSPLEATLHHLLTETDGALARQTLLQVASLPDRGEAAQPRLELSQPRWSFEIPFATPHGTAIAQFEIARDKDDSGKDGGAAKPVWRARFSLDVEPAGPVHALVALIGDKTSVRIWAERPATAAQLRDGAAQLSQALVRADLQPGDIVIRDGAPTQAAPAPAGHFLDRAL
ncbi:MAG: flagellar hook-length control protein FliK [Rhodopseudomonas sp.]|uniref:flagellar hook-length control protein FliK n=1 Tax=Rhodopseudomonas sp. TaxID=1078 RepID=UPI0018399E8B|nr:flagellar hook-length control protein FliK [Rhodopseudomonas sp.]NVN86742.1 flagellar hook-length control protein FliK [Rhodopseudomonas sp.]